MTTRRVKRIDELKRDIPPARDLWPAIAQAIQVDLSMKAVPARRRVGWMPALGLAASVALVALGVVIGIQVGQKNDIVAGPTKAATDDAGMVKASLRDAEYRKQRDQLLVEVQARLDTMSPAEREKVGASLATLKRSIQEIEAALGRDPANALLQDLLVSSCQEEMRALTAVRDSGHQEI
jgi:N-acyl-D-aspartate/D-glutamate deacylase